MPESNFVDYVKIVCRSGKGGRGSMHLRHVKYNPLGGPDGGDGGKGGSIILRGNHNYWTLLHLKYERHIFAEHGGNGGKDKCHGTDGKDVYIDVPPGTVVYNAETGKFICDVAYDGQEVMLLKGGRGGLGNFQFRTATNQAPRFAQPGEPAQEMTIIMELKLLADVGLVGFPNAGKSTLVSALSNAKPKIANYPFTTMEPSLGIVGYRDNKSFVMADIPGIIEGAAEGRGLGLRFLRHIERNSLLLFMVPGDSDNILREYNILLDELRKFNPELLSKQRVLAVTKCDLLDEELMEMLRQEMQAPHSAPEGATIVSKPGKETKEAPSGAVGGAFGSVPIVFISAVTGYHLDELKDVLWRELNSESNKLQTIMADDRLVHRDKDMSRFAQELADEDADEDIEYLDEDEIEDFEEDDDYDEAENK
ncbi:MAG: GTPase ObgE [Prevotella sp.]|nr:GTPase ObgE [Prevotella sp.]